MLLRNITLTEIERLQDQSAEAVETLQMDQEAFHGFYENCRVISANPEDAEMTLARLKLVDAAQIVFRRCLGLMGMSAPEHM